MARLEACRGRAVGQSEQGGAWGPGACFETGAGALLSMRRISGHAVSFDPARRLAPGPPVFMAVGRSRCHLVSVNRLFYICVK